VVAPIAAYYGLRTVGVPDLPALLAGGSVAAVDALLSLAIERRVRPLPIFICVTFAVTGGLAFVTHDPRVVLLKPSLFPTAMGIYILGISVNRRSLYAALAPLIARSSEERAARWKQAWEEQLSLRRSMRLACVLVGFLLLAEAAARATIVFSFTIGESLFLAHAPAVVLVVALALIVRFLVRPAVLRAMADRAFNRDERVGGAGQIPDRSS
jgi:intracellular septation protein A